ncbi:MAG: chemotaxis protein [Bartonella sp.]|nr:chemotaxis protein [Bartonella sp.]
MMKHFFKIICFASMSIPLVIDAPLMAQVTVSSLGPVQWVRALQSLQDDIASGQPGALQMQPRILEDIGQRFLKEQPSTWENANNVYAALIYLFNGGNPNIVETILKNVPQGVVPQNYIDGAIAYAYHQKGRFLHAFNDLPETHNDIPSALLLSISLSTIADLFEKDPAKATKRLNWVRLAAPGSLFEEAAIRRQLKVAAMQGDIPLLRLLTRNYVTRFSHSPYANEFWREFAVSIPQFDTHFTNEQLDEFIAYAPETVQFIIFLKVSRAALIDARMQRAHFTAAKAIELARRLQFDDTTARLYYAASSVGTTAAEEAGDMLKTIAVNDLSERDRPLLMAAKAVAKGVMLDKGSLPASPDDEDDNATLPPETVGLPLDQVGNKGEGPLPVPKDDVSAKNDAVKTSTEIDQFMEQTRKKLDAVDKLLENKQ